MSTLRLIPEAGYPPPDRGRVVVWGLLGGYPFGGMSWQVLHYVAGLRRLGFDVWYVEDTGEVTALDTMEWAADPLPNVQFLARHMEALGLGDRWVYRPYGNWGDWFGNGGQERVVDLYRNSDAIFNVCGFRWVDPQEDIRAPLVYIDTDPGDLQVHVARGDATRLPELERYEVVSTYAENIGSPTCRLPAAHLDWVPTRPPVVLDWWLSPPPQNRPPLTTISQWFGDRTKWLEWEGERFEWRKDKLFLRFLELPRGAPWPLELALRGYTDDVRVRLEGNGWSVAEARDLDEPSLYREYIRSSAGEFTVAKEQNARLNTGWFSDRSVCYLAAGRPVITEETGFSQNVPCGEGLFSYVGSDDALAAIEAMATDYPRHAAAAQEVAREYFATDRVIGDLCTRVGLL